MSKFILCQGIQGSGKSTYAKKWAMEDPEHRVRLNYDEEIGKEICLKRIENQIWFLLGYQLQEDLYRSGELVL